MELIIFGPPGSGKGTYSSELEDRLGIQHIATGDIFREAVKRDNELGNKVSKYLEEGELVPDSLVNKVVKRKLEEIGKTDFILDGYPRTVEQAKFMEGVVEIDALIRLDIPNEVVIKRISSRRICEECGEVYNTLFLKPEEEGVCDECGGNLYQREDDKPEVIKERINTYRERSSSVLDFYKEKVPFVNIKCEIANADVDKVVNEIIDGMKEKGLVD